jgi:hypothetical protein
MSQKRSRGTRMMSLRMPDELRSAIQSYCDSTADRRYEGPLTVTTFILGACREKLAHLARSNRKRTPKLRGEQLAEAALTLLASDRK